MLSSMGVEDVDIVEGHGMGAVPLDAADGQTGGWPLLDGQTGCGLIVLTICFFKGLHSVVELSPLPRALAKCSESKLFRWRNVIVSCAHASVTGTVSLTCFFWFKDPLWDDMIEFINWPTFMVCCFATGYFIYDTLDIIGAGRVVEQWEIIVHHCAIVFCTFWAIVNTTAIGYHIVAMIFEANTIFLHLRKLLQWARVPSRHWFVVLIRYTNLVTFVPFRFVPMVLLYWGCWVDGGRVPFWFICMFVSSLVILLGVNSVLYYRLVVADVLHGGGVVFVEAKEAATTGSAFAHHRKVNSTAGVCGSMNVEYEYVPLGKEDGAADTPTQQRRPYKQHHLNGDVGDGDKKLF